MGFVKIVEMGPRDGLQNEAKNVPTAVKLEFIEALILAGLRHIEVTSFVSPQWVPQMSDHLALVHALPKLIEKLSSQAQNMLLDTPVDFLALVPNQKGFEAALSTPIQHIAVFAAASETFSKKNINAGIDQSLDNFAPIVKAAKQQAHPLQVRGYVSCSLGCPYEGKIAPSAVLKVAKALERMGCDEISVGDTIGVGTPLEARALVRLLKKEVPVAKLAVHFHDTYGQALANILVCLEEDIRIIDSSTGGLGGCPYAKGASGNVATEDVLYLLNGLGLQTGISLDKIVQAAYQICAFLEHSPTSKVAKAMHGKVVNN